MEYVSNEEMWAELPADLTDTDVVSVQVTAPFTVAPRILLRSVPQTKSAVAAVTR